MSARAQAPPAAAFDDQPRVVERGPHHNVIEWVAARRAAAAGLHLLTSDF